MGGDGGWGGGWGGGRPRWKVVTLSSAFFFEPFPKKLEVKKN